MADDKVSLPSGMGGLIRYSEEGQSKNEIKPGVVILFIVLILVFELILHNYGKGLLG
ncbi:preprotein translocase subunit Sec61beta [Candidatus Woesearchaeota archaeon]|nr:preprotein translocase subunit Sec61beta [Candidatus Woesearchaeota archaeon]